MQVAEEVAQQVVKLVLQAALVAEEKVGMEIQQMLLLEQQIQAVEAAVVHQEVMIDLAQQAVQVL
jgi:hypothetical protein